MAALPKPLPVPDDAPWGEYVDKLGSLTVETFDALPLQAGWTYELHEGRLIVMPGPAHRHGVIHGRLARIIGDFLIQHGIGEISLGDCYNLPLPGETEELLCPDLSYATPERWAQAPMRGAYPVMAPDFVIEIASPSDTRPQMAAKADVYLRAGVRLLWVVWPEDASVDVWQPNQLPFRRPAGEHVDGRDVLPGLVCPVTALFAET